MIISNLNKFTVIIFILLLVVSFVVFYFQFSEFKKTHNKQRFYSFIALLVWFIILLFPIFWIKSLKNWITEWLWTNIVFVLDVSKSMNALDFSENRSLYSRLTVSKEFIADFIWQNPWNKYSLVVFAWDTQRVLPFTTDKDLFITMLSSIDENNVSKQGTNLVDAIRDWYKNFTKDDNFGALVLISDWSDDNSINLDWLKDLKNNKNIKLLVVWVWTNAGAPIPIWQDLFGQIMYKTYNWEKVITKVSETVLKEIANYFDWSYFHLDELSNLYSLSSILKDITKKTFKTDNENTIDLTRNFVIISFLFFMCYLILLIRYDKNKK